MPTIRSIEKLADGVRVNWTWREPTMLSAADLPESVTTPVEAETWIAANLAAYWGVDSYFAASVHALSPLDVDLTISDDPLP